MRDASAADVEHGAREVRYSLRFGGAAAAALADERVGRANVLTQLAARRAQQCGAKTERAALRSAPAVLLGKGHAQQQQAGPDSHFAKLKPIHSVAVRNYNEKKSCL